MTSHRWRVHRRPSMAVRVSPLNDHGLRMIETFFFDQDMTEPELIARGGGQSAVFSSRSPGKNGPNQDSAAVIEMSEDHAILVLADGMGGGRLGEEASMMTVKQIFESLEKAHQHGEADLLPAMFKGIESAHEKVQAMGVGAATTIAVAEIIGRTLRSYHVGDSMVLAVGQRGKVKLKTVAHSPVGFAVESGMINEDDAMHHHERHLVSNLVGMGQMSIEVGATVELAARDTVLVASDGLFDNLRVEEIVERMRKGPLDRAAQRMAADARARMAHRQADQPSKPDDLTFVLHRPGKKRRRRR